MKYYISQDKLLNFRILSNGYRFKIQQEICTISFDKGEERLNPTGFFQEVMNPDNSHEPLIFITQSDAETYIYKQIFLHHEKSLTWYVI